MKTTAFAIVIAVVCSGCLSSYHKIDTTHKIEPIEIKINVNVKITGDNLDGKMFEKQNITEEKETEKERELRLYLADK